MALTSYLSPFNTSVANSTISYNTEIIEIFKQDGEYINSDDTYNISIRKPQLVVNSTREHNETTQWKKKLNNIFTEIMSLTLIVIMLGMGCHVYWKEIYDNLWPPLPILIGMSGQFIIMPAMAFAISILFKMEPYIALGCLIISSSPGGALSNFFTYWVHGDVALSLVMTTCSTFLSFGTIPLNLWIYSPHIMGSNWKTIVLPYKNIIITLCFVCVPVIIGMVIRHFNERIANKITQITSIISYILVVFNVFFMLILYSDTIISATWYLHISAIILPAIGLFLAYIVAYFSKRSHKVCRTIGIETASQNIPVAVGIIVRSFSEIEVRNKMLLYPTLYGLYMLSEICLGAALFSWYYYRQQKSKLQENTETSEMGNR